MSLEEFRRVIGDGFKRWQIHLEDLRVFAIARTWRLGPPEAQHMVVWKILDFARLDDRTSARRGEPMSAAVVDQRTISIADMDAGVYEDIGLEML